MPRINYDWAQSSMLFHFYNYRVHVKPVDFSLLVEEITKVSKRLKFSESFEVSRLLMSSIFT